MTLMLYRYRNRSASISLIGGMAVGSIIEYVLSWAQEALFGSTSWDYSSMPMNLLGQICLPFSLLWILVGIIAVVVDDYLRYWLFGEEKPHYKLI